MLVCPIGSSLQWMRTHYLGKKELDGSIQIREHTLLPRAFPLPLTFTRCVKECRLEASCADIMQRLLNVDLHAKPSVGIDIW